MVVMEHKKRGGQPQHLDTLPRANRMRLDRAELLRGVRGREVDPVTLVLDPPECLGGMFVFDFLRQVPFIGPTKIRELNRQAIRGEINLAVNLADLSRPKREWLAARLGGRGRSPLARRPQG